MPGDVSPEARVSYSVSELFSEQNRILERIEGKVDGKADKSDLIPIIARLDDHHTRLMTLEDGRKADTAVAVARVRERRTVAWVTGSILVPLAVALILVFVH